MVFNRETKEIAVATAGYRPVKILKNRDDSFLDILPDGVAVGIMEDYEYDTVKMKLQPDDIILLSSAGVEKTINMQGVPFGNEKLSELVIANRNEKSFIMVEGIKNTILQYGAGMAQQDDITVLIARVK